MLGTGDVRLPARQQALGGVLPSWAESSTSARRGPVGGDGIKP